MRLNKYLAASTMLSRRKADEAIAAGRVTVNNHTARHGTDVTDSDIVALDNRLVTPATNTTTVILNKPRGYVVSRDGQGSKTIYNLLPQTYQQLNPVGRLDKDSSGLLVLTNDGQLAQELTHPSRQKVKVYEVSLDKPLQPLHQQMITDHGIMLEDGISKFIISRYQLVPDKRQFNSLTHTGQIRNYKSEDGHCPPNLYEIQMSEGRNRQIRRTFADLGYTVSTLHRTQFGPYRLDGLQPGAIRKV